MNRERAKNHGRDDRKSAVERDGMDPRLGAPGQRARMKVQAGFRR